MAWENATKEERSQIIATLFEAVHCDPATKTLVALEPREAFRPLFQQLGPLDWQRKGTSDGGVLIRSRE